MGDLRSDHFYLRVSEGGNMLFIFGELYVPGTTGMRISGEKEKTRQEVE